MKVNDFIEFVPNIVEELVDAITGAVSKAVRDLKSIKAELDEYEEQMKARKAARKEELETILSSVETLKQGIADATHNYSNIGAAECCLRLNDVTRVLKDIIKDL